MLPALPTPTLPSPAAAGRFLPRALAALAVAAALLLSLALGGCGGPGQPPRSVLLDALGQQILLTQRDIARALRLESGGLPQVSRVRVEEQEAIRIGAARGLRLSGRFDWRLAGDPFRVDSPFEIYLQRGERGETWRLARPSGSVDGTTQDWLTYPLPLPGEPRG